MASAYHDDVEFGRELHWGVLGRRDDT
jgi:hypothetical protein